MTGQRWADHCELCGGPFASPPLPDIQVIVQATGESWDNTVTGTVVICRACAGKPVTDLIAAIAMRQAVEDTRLAEDRRSRGLDS